MLVRTPLAVLSDELRVVTPSADPGAGFAGESAPERKNRAEPSVDLGRHVHAVRDIDAALLLGPRRARSMKRCLSCSMVWLRPGGCGVHLACACVLEVPAWKPPERSSIDDRTLTHAEQRPVATTGRPFGPSTKFWLARRSRERP